MYLNVNCTPSSNNIPESVCTTPRTPEILNLLAGPFENYASNFPASNTPNQQGSGAANNNASHVNNSQANPSQRAGMASGVGLPWGAASTPGDGPNSPHEAAFSTCSSLSSPSTPSTPAGASIQHARTFLIKEGLKLTIQSKRIASGRGSIDLELEAKHPRHHDESSHSSGSNLTPEDEDRRRRRRERNKVAATKCRNRKKEKTVILLKESDTLEDQNVGLRSEIQRLEAERRRLMDVLTLHSATCSRGVNTNYAPLAPPPLIPQAITTAMEPAAVPVSYHHIMSPVPSGATMAVPQQQPQHHHPPTPTQLYNSPSSSDPHLQPHLNTPCNNVATSGTYTSNTNDSLLSYEAMYNVPRVPSYENLGQCHQNYQR